MIAELYAEEAGVELVAPQDPMVHPDLPWLCGKFSKGGNV